MKKLIALLTLVLFAFIGCEKQPMQSMEPKKEQTHFSETGIDTSIKGEYVMTDVVPVEPVRITYHVESNSPIKSLKYIAPIKKGSKYEDDNPTYFDTFEMCGQKEFTFSFETRYTTDFTLIGTVSKNASLDVSISVNGSKVFDNAEISTYKNLFKDFRLKMPGDVLHFRHEDQNQKKSNTETTGNQKQRK